MIGVVVTYLAKKLKDNKSVQGFSGDFTDATVGWLRPVFLTDDGKPNEALADLQEGPNDETNIIGAENKIAKITSIFQNDRLLINELKCIIIAYFTSSDYENYSSMKSEINKRLIQIIRERILSVLVTQ